MFKKKHASTVISRSKRKKAGEALRHLVPLESHGIWVPSSDRPDPIRVLRQQDEGRIESLLPIKYGRMVASPFAFLRGSAAVMAADLTTTPTAGLQVQLCGDAHLSNFGIFASPERKLVFDINDFDETHPGPFEWDLKRLVTSAVVAGRENGFSDNANRNLAIAITRRYAREMDKLARARTLDVWCHHVDTKAILETFEGSSKSAHRSVRTMVGRAKTKTQQQALEKLTHLVDGRRRFISEPPLLVPLEEFVTDEQQNLITITQFEEMWTQYLESLPEERQHLLSRFRITHGALRVGGVGSVGTRCMIFLLEGGAEDDAIILQQKEAGPSVLEPYTENSKYESPAERVVQGLRLTQSASDIFLGWHQGSITGIHYYWRQLKDMKGSLDVTGLNKVGFETYLEVCAACLARAHARTGDAAKITGYIGNGNTLSRAIAQFAFTYADQTKRDHKELKEAVESGRVTAQIGI